jgi:meso-butanediol dehydrogenase/(S,S)-butanediol dehydrogenase/diacetyl reductase
MLLKGKKALITGVSGTVGSEIAKAFQEEGAEVLGVDWKRTDSVTYCDVTDERSVRSVFDRAEMAGNVTDVVHTAGIVSCGLLHDLSKSDFENVINVNLIGSFLVARQAVNSFSKLESIIFISSQAGLKSAALWSAYSASKAGVLRICEALAQEVGPRAIRVNAVCPGNIESPMMDDAVSAVSLLRDKKPSDVTKRYLDDIPLKRFARPAEIASVCVFLASPMASYVNGSSYVVDGGELS